MSQDMPLVPEFRDVVKQMLDLLSQFARENLGGLTGQT